MPATEAGSVDHAYVRFHGRNAEAWEDHASSPDRYDYAYSRDELAPWAQRIAALETRKKVVRVYFNNHPGAHAPNDAEAFGGMLRERGAALDPPPSRGQQRL
jgi:uncharacterized protein YecE (DUF72 family)